MHYKDWSPFEDSGDVETTDEYLNWFLFFTDCGDSVRDKLPTPLSDQNSGSVWDDIVQSHPGPVMKGKDYVQHKHN